MVMDGHLEIAIIGAGPAGLAAAANAAQHQLSHVLIEKGEIGNTVFNYQLRKYVMAEPGRLPLRGEVPFIAGSREQVLKGWSDAVAACGINVMRGEVTQLERREGLFEISTGAEKILAKKVILAIGVQGSPRMLGVPGEDLPHVTYTLSDPEAFVGQNILVVGAGDAAIENALALMEANNVSILNRTADFPRAKEANSAKILEAIQKGKIRLFANAEMLRVEAKIAQIQTPDGLVALDCDQIIARLGCLMPRKFLESCGITFPSTDPLAVPVVSKNYESNVPGLYILGALIGYPLIKQAMNQGYEVIEYIVGNPVEPADQVLVQEKLAGLSGSIDENLLMLRQSLPLFRELSEAQFREMIIESTLHRLRPREIIFERNDYTDSLINIVSGSAKVMLPNGGEVTISSGNFLGEIGLLSGRRRSATVVAAEDSLILETPRKQMLKLVSSVEAVKRAVNEAFTLRALQTNVFPQAPTALLIELGHRVKAKNFKKGEVLCREGDVGDVAWVIRKGSVRVVRQGKSGVEITQSYIAAGNIVGEMALLSAESKPRNATLVAAVPCETIVIEKADLHSFLEKSPQDRLHLEELARQRALENVIAERDAYTSSLLEFAMTQGVTDADNFLLIDSDLCIGCDNCEKACAATHHGYSRLDRKGGKSFAALQIPISCRHCENPLCMLDCPPDALTRMPSGEVVIRDSCIGCGNCVRNCPYGVIQLVYDGSGESLVTRLMHRIAHLMAWNKNLAKGPAKAGKCDMCSDLAGGPACVRSCPTGAAIRVNPSQMLKLVEEKRR